MQKVDTEKLNGIYLEFERLANRVERSNTHYQVLGVENGASLEEVKRAYRSAVSLIQPVYSGRYRSIEAESQAKAVRVLRKTSNAFSILSNFGKRIEYDAALFRKRPGLIPFSESVPDGPLARLFSDSVPEPASRLSIFGDWEPQDAYSPGPGRQRQGPVILPSGADAADKDRRRFERFEMVLPVRIIGYDRIAGEWDDEGETLDISRAGIRIRTCLNLKHGNVVQLQLEMPAKLRTHSLADPIYVVYAIARRIEPQMDGMRTMGLEFLGQKPPDGYLDRPWATYRIGWSGLDRRREPREQKSEVVSVKYLDEAQSPLRREIALTENVSPSGAMIFVKGAPPETEFIHLANLSRSFESLARICDRYVADDGLERLSLNFMEAKWFLE